MAYWLHIARSIDRVTLHRDRCTEIPTTHQGLDVWESQWVEYPDKQRALAAMEQTGVESQRHCTLCKP